MTMGDNNKTTFGDFGPDALWGAVSTEVRDRGRWSEYMLSVVEKDGHYYEVQWSRGLTEIQEDEYPDDSEVLTEVFPETRVLVRSEHVWLPSPSPTPEPVIGHDMLGAFRTLGLGDAVNAELESLRDVDTSALRAALSVLTVLPQDDRFRAFRDATLQFLEELSE